MDCKKDICIQSESWNKKTSVSAHLTTGGNMHVGQLKFFATLLMSKNASEYWFWGSNSFYWVGRFANTESVNNDNQLYLSEQQLLIQILFDYLQ